MSNLSYEQLIECISRGVIHKPPNKKPPKNIKPYPGAYKDGWYQGAPGKDIYFSLYEFSDDQIDGIVKATSLLFPKEAPSDHVGYAACIRYIYGQFEKQGILRSINDHRRMKEELKHGKIDWSKPRQFISDLQKEFMNQKNYYGMAITCEMEGHRLGDEAVVLKDKSKLNEMENMYLKSVKYAKRCKSYKQLFTPYYWSTMYFVKFKNKSKAHDYAISTIDMADEYCPDSRGSYKQKIIDCLDVVEKFGNWKSSKHFGRWLRSRRKKSKNTCVLKAIEEKVNS